MHEQGATGGQRRAIQVVLGVAVVVLAGLWIWSSRSPMSPAPVRDASVAQAPEARQAPAPPEAPAEPETLSFRVQEGRLDNHFFRRGEVAAHLVLSSGRKPRLVVAFPAGNSGLGIWFEESAAAVSWSVIGPIEAAAEPGDLRGVRVKIEAVAKRLVVSQAVLGSVRILRDYMHGVVLPEQWEQEQSTDGPLRWSREGVGGQVRYRARLDLEGGATSTVGAGAKVVLEAPEGSDRIRMTLLAATSDKPLTPIPMTELLSARAKDDRRARESLAFLSYREKLLAGSWRFLTYFGRDTLLSVRLLMDALAPSAVEAGLGSVLERLSDKGEVAHEEEISEWAALQRERHGPAADPVDAPLHDYKMIDDDLLLAPVAAHYLLHTEPGRQRAQAFLARRAPGGASYAELLRRNLMFVLERARPFAEAPSLGALLKLREGLSVGEWRDSPEGLGGGRAPYNVNAVLVPAALRAAASLFESPLLGAPAKEAQTARAYAEVWDGADAYFRVEVQAETARDRIRTQAEAHGLPPNEAAGAVKENVVFRAIALDESGDPVEVMHTDGGFLLLFADPPPPRLEQIAAHILRPFPAGLRTPVGVVVANAALASNMELRRVFSERHYHGAVVWSWQQALLAAGLKRQLARKDLPGETRDMLSKAQSALWEVIDATPEMQTSELWSWTVEGGRMKVAPFGQSGGDVTESNAAQLWSTVYLAVRRPR